MDYFNKTITFKVDEGSALFEGAKNIVSTHMFSGMTAHYLMKAGCERYIVFITEDKRSQGTEEIPIVCEFPGVSQKKSLVCHQFKRQTSR